MIAALAVAAAWVVASVAVAVVIGRGIRLADQRTCPDTVPTWLTEQVEK